MGSKGSKKGSEPRNRGLFANYMSPEKAQEQARRQTEHAQETGAQINLATHTKKRDEFMKAGTLDDKPASFIPWVGDVLASKLADNGFTKAVQVVGQYMALNRDKHKFKEWIKSIADNAKGEEIYNAVKDWCDKHLKI
ncbi:PREDICTED: barrier-to-autointegration factor-like isoform X2 [Branchiostoma belcheri]|uniref:Barrier-to-autointegration factor-like isoform X2 n=1 Tax=Branchiostoma belcheri TaxID=7741 RepID=A0A6P4Z2A9_BRABE|nr:PREDICTED: barrier-to-autointegration factor-like isoform X2 [Branchiostoma belcheri]